MVQKIGWLKIVSGYQLLVQFPDFLENASIHFKKYFYSFSKYLVPDMYHGSVIPAQIKKKNLYHRSESQLLTENGRISVIWKDN